MRHLLIVDDDADICDVLRMGLELRGACYASVATNAEAALAVLRRDRPDAALIDAVLAGQSGLALARQAIDFGTPVLVMTGEPGHQQRLCDAGCHFLPKPFAVSQARIELECLIGDARRQMAQLAAALDRLPQDGHGRPPARQPAPSLDGILRAALAATGAEMGNIQVLDPASGTLRIAASHGFARPFLEFFAVVEPGGRSACAAALKAAGRVVVPDVTRSAIFAGTLSGEALRLAGVRAVQSTPAFGRAGQPVGVVSTHSASVWKPSAAALARLDALVAHAATEIEAA